MTEKIRILVLSSNPWNVGRILAAEEVREISDRIEATPYRDRFEVHNHGAVRPIDLQRLLMKYEPQIVHVIAHGSDSRRLLLNGTHGGAEPLDQHGLTSLFALYNNHVRLVVLNACCTNEQARSISEVVDYSIGTARPVGDKASVMFAVAFYNALGCGKSVRDAFNRATAELGLIKMRRSEGFELFVKNGLDEKDRFPQIDTDRNSHLYDHSTNDSG